MSKKEHISIAKQLYLSDKDDWHRNFPYLKEIPEKEAIDLLSDIVKKLEERWEREDDQRKTN